MLLPFKDPLARDFYAQMCSIERWSVRTLLKAGGQAAVVLPDNALFEGGAGEKIRVPVIRLVGTFSCRPRSGSMRPA